MGNGALAPNAGNFITMSDASNAVNDGFEVVKVKHKGALWIPEAIQEKYKIKDGDHFKLIPLSPVKFILEKILIIAVVAMLPMGFILPTFAHAQSDISNIVNQINPQPTFNSNGQIVSAQVIPNQPTQYNLSPGEHLIPLSADIAKLPLYIEATYPSGASPIWNVSRVFGSNYFQSESVVDSLTTKVFSTGMPDTWTITIGQKYDKPTDQVARIVVRSNNTQIIPGIIIPIDGTEFKVTFLITTAHPVKLPTGEDIAKPITSRLDQIIENQVTHNDRSESTETTLTYAANSFRLTILLWIGIAATVVAAVVVIWRLARKISDWQPPTQNTPLKARFRPFGGRKGGDNQK